MEYGFFHSPQRLLAYFDSGNSQGARVSDDETRVKNLSVVYFMRIA